MRFQAGLQILLIIIAIVMIVMVLKPEFAEIQYNQNEIAQYRKALEQAGLYNNTLQALLQRASDISFGDREALERFLPDRVDVAMVSRDIKNIIDRNGMLLLEIEAEASDAATVESTGRRTSEDGFIRGEALESEARNDLAAIRFSVDVIGSYEQMKNMLRDLEQNAYPLRLAMFSFDAPSDSELYNYSLELETYSTNR